MKPAVQNTQRGWTLIELMVAMALSLLLIAGIGQIYLAAKRSYEIQTHLTQLQDIGRYVAGILTHDIHQAGYWGLMDINAPITVSNDAPPGTCPTGSTAWGRMITRRLFGINDTASGYDCIGDKAGGSGDVLVVRYADPTILRSPPTDKALYIRTAAFAGVLSNGAPGALALKGPTSDHAVVAHAYYVRKPASLRVTCGSARYAVPELARVELSKIGHPSRGNLRGLVPGVEQIQFRYGVDTDGNGSVNSYLDADRVAEWNQVRAVRFWFLVRATCPESGYTNNTPYILAGDTITFGDGFRRAVYSSTVELRNKAPL